jgi:hypothetical protein
METVVGLFPSYPIFLWITGCKILFIVGDQFWKTRFHHFHSGKKSKKNHTNHQIVILTQEKVNSIHNG